MLRCTHNTHNHGVHTHIILTTNIINLQHNTPTTTHTTTIHMYITHIYMVGHTWFIPHDDLHPIHSHIHGWCNWISHEHMHVMVCHSSHTLKHVYTTHTCSIYNTTPLSQHLIITHTVTHCEHTTDAHAWFVVLCTLLLKRGVMHCYILTWVIHTHTMHIVCTHTNITQCWFTCCEYTSWFMRTYTTHTWVNNIYNSVYTYSPHTYTSTQCMVCSQWTIITMDSVHTHNEINTCTHIHDVTHTWCTSWTCAHTLIVCTHHDYNITRYTLITLCMLQIHVHWPIHTQL